MIKLVAIVCDSRTSRSKLLCRRDRRGSHRDQADMSGGHKGEYAVAVASWGKAVQGEVASHR